MNDARYNYLQSYFCMDILDQMIQHCHIGYRCRKHWHSSMNHLIALAIVLAFGMYLEAASGSLCPEWKVENLLISTSSMTNCPTKCSTTVQETNSTPDSTLEMTKCAMLSP
mmetsp:Transcript_34023/g.82490  ORF Transcript_34023/g.82490 Transcript_34023/m.82490 type:complete len:111 (-) Transcript_34023:1096-1428(-)